MIPDGAIIRAATVPYITLENPSGNGCHRTILGADYSRNCLRAAEGPMDNFAVAFASRLVADRCQRIALLLRLLAWILGYSQHSRTGAHILCGMVSGLFSVAIQDIVATSCSANQTY